MKKFRAKNGRTMNLTDKLAYALVKMGKGTIVKDEPAIIGPIEVIKDSSQPKIIEATQEPVDAKSKKKTK